MELHDTGLVGLVGLSKSKQLPWELSRCLTARPGLDGEAKKWPTKLKILLVKPPVKQHLIRPLPGMSKDERFIAGMETVVSLCCLEGGPPPSKKSLSPSQDRARFSDV